VGPKMVGLKVRKKNKPEKNAYNEEVHRRRLDGLSLQPISRIAYFSTLKMETANDSET
jgi:hypothetical protein